jgi:S-adenosylmethionine-diacylgycerolhomoserine-N-methlytransferase
LPTDHAAIAALMDRNYRFQRHIYDATRKYYLLGRDPLISGLAVPQGAAVLEIGCGTGRNLLQVAHRYPDARLFGLDISAAMLEKADATHREGRPFRPREAGAAATRRTSTPQALFGAGTASTACSSPMRCR